LLSHGKLPLYVKTFIWRTKKKEKRRANRSTLLNVHSSNEAVSIPFGYGFS
jgi:hypothetical protein